MSKSDKTLDSLRDMVNNAARTVAKSATAVTPDIKEEADVAVRQEEVVAKVTDLRDNPFHKIFTDPALDTPLKKKEAVLALLTADATKDEAANNALMSDLTAYLEKINTTLKDLGINQVKNSSFETIALLQSVTDGILGNLSELKKALEPFTSVIDVIQGLREANAQIDLIESVRQDRKEDEVRAIKRAERDAKLAELQDTISGATREKEILVNSAGGVEKWMSGFMNTSYKSKISTLDTDIRLAQEKVALIEEEIIQEVDLMKREAEEAELDPTFKSRRALRGLLDIGSEEIEKRHKDIKTKAVDFIENSSQKVTDVIDALEVIKLRIQQRSTTVGRAGSVVTILNESVTEALHHQSDELNKVQQALDGEKDLSETEKLIGKRSAGRLERYVGELKANMELTVTSLGEVTENEAAIANELRNNNEIISSAKNMRSRVISATAMRTGITMDTVLTAAGREALGVVHTAVEDWDKFTSKTLSNALGQTVMNEQDANKRLLMMIERMGELTGAVGDTTTQIGQQTKITFTLLDQLGINASELQEKVDMLKGIDAQTFREYAADRERVMAEGTEEAAKLLGDGESARAFNRAAEKASAPKGGAPAGGDMFGGMTFAPVRAPVFAPSFA